MIDLFIAYVLGIIAGAYLMSVIFWLVLEVNNNEGD